MMFATRMIYIHQAVLYTINPRTLCERLLIVVCLFETHAQGAKFYSLLLSTDGFIVPPFPQITSTPAACNCRTLAGLL